MWSDVFKSLTAQKLKIFNLQRYETKKADWEEEDRHKMFLDKWLKRVNDNYFCFGSDYAQVKPIDYMCCIILFYQILLWQSAYHLQRETLYSSCSETVVQTQLNFGLNNVIVVTFCFFVCDHEVKYILGKLSIAVNKYLLYHLHYRCKEWIDDGISDPVVFVPEATAMTKLKNNRQSQSFLFVLHQLKYGAVIISLLGSLLANAEMLAGPPGSQHNNTIISKSWVVCC